MPAHLRSAVVLGAGTMGAEVAAHLANAGIPVQLFDRTADLALAGLTRASAARPPRFYTSTGATLIETGSFDDLHRVAGADWVIEAVVEDADAKRRLLAQVDVHRRADTIVSSNTSGLSIASLAEGRSDGFRRHWLGTHFFNPPRYMTLVELVPTQDTDPEVVSRLSGFIDRRLGKGVVIAKDTPAFIANRLAMFATIRTLDAVATGEYTIEDIDALTGPLIGRPKSATFRTLDLAGLDIVAHVAGDLSRRAPEAERSAFALPPFVADLIAQGRLGEKSGQGFYRKTRAADGTHLLALDVASLTYRELRPSTIAPHAAAAIPDLASRLRTLFLGDDRAGDLLRRTLGALLVYAARVAPAIAHSIDDVDRAMQWGFGWELGPFETWDAIGVPAVLERCDISDPPPLVADLLRSGRTRFRSAPLAPAQAGLLLLQTAKSAACVVRQNAGASLVDLGDGVLAVEFHSKMNTLGGDAIDMLRAGVTEAAANFAALIVGNEAVNFSAGANLMLLLLEAQEGNWDEVDAMVRAFQGATMALKTSPVPVVAAPAGRALGGGCEICLHTAHVQAAAETYLGLVEVSVGLIPAGGGAKELLLRATDEPSSADRDAPLRRIFETMGFARVSTSAADARRLGYLRPTDGVTMNRERVIADAKRAALALVTAGYQPPAPRPSVPVGGADSRAVLDAGIHIARQGGHISDHDAIIGRKLAWVLTGGEAVHATRVSEQYLLDLEREAFVSLCGEQKTLERVAYTLKTGKILRN